MRQLISVYIWFKYIFLAVLAKYLSLNSLRKSYLYFLLVVRQILSNKQRGVSFKWYSKYKKQSFKHSREIDRWIYIYIGIVSASQCGFSDINALCINTAYSHLPSSHLKQLYCALSSDGTSKQNNETKNVTLRFRDNHLKMQINNEKSILWGWERESECALA